MAAPFWKSVQHSGSAGSGTSLGVQQCCPVYVLNCAHEMLNCFPSGIQEPLSWALFLEMTFQKRKSRFLTAQRDLASSSHCDGGKNYFLIPTCVSSNSGIYWGNAVVQKLC